MMIKKSLVILSIVMSLVMVGAVSADIVEFVSPEEGSYVDGDVLVSWENGDFEVGWLKYKEGVCDGSASGYILASEITAEGEYVWDTDSLDNGDYCLKITGTLDIFGDITVGIDNTDPVADANGPYSCEEGDFIMLDASGSTDNSEGDSGIKSYLWDFDDDGEYDAEGVEVVYECLDGDASEDVHLTVVDFAGNEDSDEAEVEISNVAPWNLNILDGSEAIVGQEIQLTGEAEDVEADMDSLEYEWDFGDGDDDEGQEVSHVYDEAGEYEIELTITDKDDGSSSTTLLVEVIDAIFLEGQEILAFETLVYDFECDLECELVIPEDEGISVSNVDGHCRISWTPTNSQRGEHQVIIKASDVDDKVYYSLTITVYSWMIELEEGWNLVSIPLVPEDTYYKTVFAGIRENLITVWSYEYDPLEDKSSWHGRSTTKTGWSTSGSKNWGKLQDIVPGRSYWLNMEQADVLKGFGGKTYSSPTEESSPAGIPEVILPTNSWSLIGKYGLYGGSMDDETALLSLDGDMTLIDESVSLVDILNPQEGYWLWIKNYDIDNEVYTPLDEDYYQN